MDRFIVNIKAYSIYSCSKFKIQYGQIYRKQKSALTSARKDLKSNMDRFIAFPIDQKGCEGDHLKSNMDRFIVRKQNSIQTVPII